MTRLAATRLSCATWLALTLAAATAQAQPIVQSPSPTLAELLKNVYGANGLVVDSEAVLPDGSTHSAHFNGAFQSEFGEINVALVRQLVALPVPSPASGFTYSFDQSTGTFLRSTQSFGPILADRAETIGRGKFSFGYTVQHFAFRTFDGVDLRHIRAVFTHDNPELLGGREDVITTENAIAASVTQSTAFLTYGALDRLDLSLAVPMVRTRLDVMSAATIRRIGTGENRAVHFFRDPDASGTLGNARRFVAGGSATGVGDIIARAKGTAFKTVRAGLAVGAEVRVPTGDEQNLLGSGSVGVKAFEAVSFVAGRIAPHVNLAYEWNGDTVLAGDVATGIKGPLPDEFSYIVGADAGVVPRLTLTLDVIGRHSTDAPRLTATTFTTAGAVPQTFGDITFRTGALNIVTAALGMKLNVVSTVLVSFDLQFNLNDAGLRTRITPLVGFEYGF